MSYSQYHCSKSPFKKEEGGEETKENKRPLDRFSSSLNKADLIEDRDSKVAYLNSLETGGDPGKEKAKEKAINATKSKV